MQIGGMETGSSNESWIRVVNPATGEYVDRVPEGTADDVSRAVDAAQAAFDGWCKVTPRERGKILSHAAGMVRERHTAIAPMLTWEEGKPIRESVDEVRGFANILEFYAGISASLQGEYIPLGRQGEGLVVHEPLGVCGAIVPWNVPAIVMGWKVAPALLGGNTMVLKPSSTAPLTCLLLASLLEEAGLPPGVLNVVTGSGEVAGTALVRHPNLQKISFTGSTEIGSQVLALAREAGRKEILLELGGSDPMIVWKDADIPSAVVGAIRGRYYNTGQTCNAVKRLYLHEEIVDRFLEMLTAQVHSLRVGNGIDPKVDMGPLHSASQREGIIKVVDQIRNEGGKILTGGEIPLGTGYDKGFFYQPTVITEVPENSQALSEEVFGPVLPVCTYSTLQEALKMANSSRYGLGASVWTQNLSVVRMVFREVKAGIVWVNRHLTVPPEIPFGGVKESGMGRENGIQALLHYTRTKSLFLSS